MRCGGSSPTAAHFIRFAGKHELDRGLAGGAGLEWRPAAVCGRRIPLASLAPLRPPGKPGYKNYASIHLYI